MAVLDVGAWRLATIEDLSGYSVTPEGAPIERRFPAKPGAGGKKCTCVAEVVHRISGLVPHAVIAWAFEPSGGTELQMSAVRGAAFDTDIMPDRSPLGLPVKVALPPELAEAAMDGFEKASGHQPVTAGVLKIIGGAIDHDSSRSAFSHAGALMYEVLIAVAFGLDPEPGMERLASTW